MQVVCSMRKLLFLSMFFPLYAMAETTILLSPMAGIGFPSDNSGGNVNATAEIPQFSGDMATASQSTIFGLNLTLLFGSIGIRPHYMINRTDGEETSTSASSIPLSYLAESKWTATGFGVDLIYSFSGAKLEDTSFFAGFGFTQIELEFEQETRLIPPAGSSKDVLHGSGSTLAYKGFVGMHYTLGSRVGLAIEAGYMSAMVDDLTSDDDFIIGGLTMAEGDEVRRTNSASTAFTGEKYKVDMTGPYLLGGFNFLF